MDVSETLQKAWKAVEDAGLPTEVREAAFREAVRLLSPATGTAAPATATAAPAPAPPARPVPEEGVTRGSEEAVTVTVSEEEMYERVARETGVAREKIEHLVHIEDDGPHFSIPGNKLGKSQAMQIRTVAQVLTILRLYGLGESETPIDVIRSECKRLKVYDDKNFSTLMGKVDGFVKTESGRLKAKVAGKKAFPDLVDQLLGES